MIAGLAMGGEIQALGFMLAVHPQPDRHIGQLGDLGALARQLGAGPAIIVLGDVLRERGALATLKKQIPVRASNTLLG